MQNCFKCFLTPFRSLSILFMSALLLGSISGCGGSSDGTSEITLEDAIARAGLFEEQFTRTAKAFSNEIIVSITGVGVDDRGIVTNAEPADNPGWYFTLIEDDVPGELLGVEVTFDDFGNITTNGGLFASDTIVDSPELPAFTSAELQAHIATADAFLESNGRSRPVADDRVVFIGEDGADGNLELIISYINESDFGFDFSTIDFSQLLDITDVGVLLDPVTGVAEGGLDADGFFLPAEVE